MTVWTINIVLFPWISELMYVIAFQNTTSYEIKFMIYIFFLWVRIFFFKSCRSLGMYIRSMYENTKSCTNSKQPRSWGSPGDRRSKGDPWLLSKFISIQSCSTWWFRVRGGEEIVILLTAKREDRKDRGFYRGKCRGDSSVKTPARIVYNAQGLLPKCTRSPIGNFGKKKCSTWQAKAKN